MYQRLTATVTAATLVVRHRLQQLRRAPDAGLTTAEYLMWIAIITGVVITIGALVTTLFINKANGLSLN